MENFLPFTDDVMVVLVHKCAQQTHLLALHLETLGYIPRLLNALNGLKTYAANFYVHHSRVRKKVRLSGTCLSIIYGFGSTQFSETHMSYRCSDIFLIK